MEQVDFQRDIAFPVEAVWALLEDFGNMQWAPGIARVELIGEGVGMTRRLHMDGTDPIDEVLESIDAPKLTYSYSIPRGLPLPITDYLATARLEALDDDNTRVFWSCQCTPLDPDLPRESLETMVHNTYNLLVDMVSDFLSQKA